MSITAISSSFVSAVRELAHASVPPAAAPRAGDPPRTGARRHDLVGAMDQVLGAKARQDAGGEQAVFRFAHALMHDLRSLEVGLPANDAQATDTVREPATPAGTRREWNDLPQRLDALATASHAAAAAAAPPAEVEVPAQPNPVTTNSAALHLMQVPSSRLLEAYAALRKAVGEQASAAAPARDHLAEFIDRLSKALAADTPSTLPTGSVLNLTA